MDDREGKRRVAIRANNQYTPQIGDIVRIGFEATRKSTDLIRLAYITQTDKVLTGCHYIGRHCLGGTGATHEISPLQPGDMEIWDNHAWMRPD